VAQKTHEELVGDVVRLSRENAALKREVARLQVFRAMAYRDPLTGLWNRRYFEERLREELSRSQRAGGARRFSVMIVDIDDFKRVNDRYGHAVGDTVLKDIGEFLVAHLRNHDVACRSGGDEFSILLPDLSAADCGHLEDRLRTARAAANAVAELPIQLSLGTGSWPEVGDSMEGLLAHADRAMYAYKRRRRSRSTPAGGIRRDVTARRTITRRQRAISP
jgi:diguanylate cyclase (GGDEF)-like protein